MGTFESKGQVNGRTRTVVRQSFEDLSPPDWLTSTYTVTKSIYFTISGFVRLAPKITYIE